MYNFFITLIIPIGVLVLICLLDNEEQSDNDILQKNQEKQEKSLKKYKDKLESKVK